MKTFLTRTVHVFFNVTKSLDVKICSKTEISQDNDRSHYCVTKISGDSYLFKIASTGLRKTNKQTNNLTGSWYLAGNRGGREIEVRSVRMISRN